MASKKNKNKRGLFAFLASTNLFRAGKKTKDTNEEIYHAANFPEIDQLAEPHVSTVKPQNRQ